jgi:MFS family permease
MHRGLSEATMALGLAVLNIGNVFLQIPIGWLADRFSRRLVLGCCAGATASGACLLPIAADHSAVALFALLFFWGSCAYGVTTVSLAELGDRFSGAILLAGSAAFTLASGIGGIFGGPVAGTAIDYLGNRGLIVAVATAFSALALLVGVLPLTKRSQSEQTNASAIGLGARSRREDHAAT